MRKPRPGWKARAACADPDRERFDTFSADPEIVALAKIVCLSCRSRADCAGDAWFNREQYGVRGGLSEQERVDWWWVPGKDRPYVPSAATLAVETPVRISRPGAGRRHLPDDDDALLGGLDSLMARLTGADAASALLAFLADSVEATA